MKNETKWLASFITPVVLVLVAITGTLVDGLELPVLQGGGLWVFYAVSGAMFVVSAAQLFLPAARGATTIRCSTRFLLLAASILLMLQDWVLSLIVAAMVSTAIAIELSREPSASNEGQPPGRRYRPVLSWFGLLLTVTIVVYLVQQDYQLVQQDYQDRIHRQQLEQELAQERAAVVEIRRLNAVTDMRRESGEFRVTSVIFMSSFKRTDGNIVITESRINDDGMVHLKALTELESLKIHGGNVTDAGLVHLRGLTRLRSLELKGTKTTEAGVVELQKALPNCKITR